MKKSEIAPVAETKSEAEQMSENQAGAADEQKNLETQQKAPDSTGVETDQKQAAKETPSLINENPLAKLKDELLKAGYQIVKVRIIKTFECTLRYRAGLCFGKDWGEYTVSDSELAMIQSDSFLEVAKPEA